jgi:ribosomal protein S13
MALKVADRVKQLTNTTGSGTLTLVSTPAGFQSFSSALSNSDTTYYVLVENDDFEIGVGTYSSSTLARTSVLQSSSSDNKINLGGSGTVFIGYPADKSVYQNENSQVVVGASGVTFDGSVFNIDSSGTPVSTHLMSFNMTNYGLTIGDQTGWSNGNTLVGHQAGSGLTTGSDSTMVGYQAGNRNQAGNNNTFIGHQAGPTHPGVGTTIYNSTALGYQAGNKMGINSTAIGYQSALSTNNAGFVSVGVSTGSGLGADAVAVGRSAGHDLNEQYAIAIGYQAGYEGGGTSSAWLGHAAGHSSNGATRSIGLGYQAGKSTTGDDCVYLGNSAGQSNTTDDYIFIANAAPSSNGTLIKGDMTNKRIAVGKADITLDSTLHVGINTATHVGLIVKSASAQSADLTQWQNSAGSSVAAMAKSGVLTVNGLYASGAGVQIASVTPAVTTNAIYNVGGALYFNGSAVAGGGASDTATYASGQVLSLTYASGLTATNSAIANYASGQALSLTYASGLTATNATNIVATSGISNYASGQVLSLATASGVASYASGVVTGGDIYVGEYIYHNGDTNTYIRLRGDQFDFVAGGRTMLTLDEASNDKVIVNDGGGDVNFIVESQNEENLIFTDGGNDVVGIGTNSPNYKLDVFGHNALMRSSGVIVGNSGIVLANNTPGVTTNTLYNDGGTLSWNGSAVGGGGASATATYASGQVLSLTYASGLTATNATNITSATNIANYASGQSLSLSHASGIATYASGQALSLTHASGLTATNATNITSVTSTANYASGQVLSLATASGVATYASGVVRGGIARFNKIGINTDTSPYGIQVVGAGASGLIEATGVLVGNSGVVLANNTPGVTTNTLYNNGGDLYFNGSQLATGGASATATYASGQALSLTYASGLTATNAGNIVAVSGIAHYASGQSLSLSHASGIATSLLTASGTATSLIASSGTTTALINSSGVATYASGQALSLSHASGVATSLLTASGTATSLIASSGTTTALINSSGVATYASGQALSLANASGIAAYASGQVNATAGTATASKALILDSNKSFTGIADGSFQKIGVGTTSPQYGLQLVGAGTSGVIQSSGILIGPSGIGVGTTTPVHPIDVVQHSGVVRASGMHSAISMNADAATVTFDLDQATTHGVTLGGGRTLALSNVQIGDKFLIRLQQDGTGSRTVTWFNHISWAGGSAPTLTTTANKADLLGFLTASGTGGAYWFDGLVVGQNI